MLYSRVLCHLLFELKKCRKTKGSCIIFGWDGFLGSRDELDYGGIRELVNSSL